MPNAAVEQGLRPRPVVRACSSACRLCLSHFAPRSYSANCTVAQPVFRHSSPFVAPQPRITPQQPHAIIRCKSGPGGPIPGRDARRVLDLVNDSVKWVVTLLAAFVLLRHRSVYVNWCLVGSIVAALSCKVPLLPCCQTFGQQVALHSPYTLQCRSSRGWSISSVRYTLGKRIQACHQVMQPPYPI